MSRKQWYVYAELSVNSIIYVMVEYTPTKAEAKRILKDVNKISKFCCIDFVWVSSLNVPFSKLHGNNIIKVNSIIEEVNKLNTK